MNISKYSQIDNGNWFENTDNLVWQKWAENHLLSYVSKKLKSGKVSEVFRDTLIDYTLLRKCSVCRKLSTPKKINSHFSMTTIINGARDYFSGSSCFKCAYEANALSNCLDLINEIKKELKNENRNSRRIKSISL